ncbi:MAG: glycosyltransferase family 39 protein, partial [Gemmatimonadaceae bacterium]
MSSNVLSDQASAPQLASRRATWLLSGFLLAHAILAWINRIPGISWGEDDAGYLFLARELRQLSYRELQDIALPMHARFPPLYPLIIAVVGWPFGDALNALLLMNTMFSMGAVVLLFLATRRKLGENIALIASGLFAVNPMAVWDSGHLMAESAFKFFVLLGIWALTHEDDHVKFAVLAGAAAIAAALTRTAGVVLLPALFLYWLVNRRYRWATYLFVAGSLTVGVWLAWTFLAPEPEFRRLYVADLGLAGRRHSRLQLLQNTLLHLPDRTRHMVTVVVPFVLALPVIGDTIVDNVLWMLVTASVGFTGVILLVRRWQIAAFVLVFYAALLFVW